MHAATHTAQEWQVGDLFEHDDLTREVYARLGRKFFRNECTRIFKGHTLERPDHDTIVSSLIFQVEEIARELMHLSIPEGLVVQTRGEIKKKISLLCNITLISTGNNRYNAEINFDVAE